MLLVLCSPRYFHTPTTCCPPPLCRCTSQSDEDFEILESYLARLKPEEFILVASSFSHMLNLHNLVRGEMGHGDSWLLQRTRRAIACAHSILNYLLAYVLYDLASILFIGRGAIVSELRSFFR